LNGANPDVTQSRFSGVYGWLADREEEAHRSPNCTLPWTSEQPSYTGTAERLTAFRAGHDHLALQGGTASLFAWLRA
jgi:hypothetical protein